MKKYITIALVLLGSYVTKAQTTINVPLITQHETEWCWSGCSTCMLNYYGFPVTQCQVAEYARTVSTSVNFGATNCCIDSNGACNQPNYMYGVAGSLTDILYHFGNINCYNTDSAFAFNRILDNVAHNHLLVYHWSWVGGGGHFIVGYGANAANSNVYFMNPLPLEGFTMESYALLLNDGNHTYDYTSAVLAPTSVNTVSAPVNGEMVYPNPSTGGVYVRNATTVKVYNTLGTLAYQQTIASSDKGTYVDLGNLSKGIYFVSMNEGQTSNFTKLVLQ